MFKLTNFVLLLSLISMTFESVGHTEEATYAGFHIVASNNEGPINGDGYMLTVEYGQVGEFVKRAVVPVTFSNGQYDLKLDGDDGKVAPYWDSSYVSKAVLRKNGINTVGKCENGSHTDDWESKYIVVRCEFKLSANQQISFNPNTLLDGMKPKQDQDSVKASQRQIADKIGDTPAPTSSKKPRSNSTAGNLERQGT